MLFDKEQIEYSASQLRSRDDKKPWLEELLLACDCGHKKSAKQVNDGNVEQRDCKSLIT